MTSITTGQARAILTGTELGGHAQRAYHVSLAVPNALLGVAHGGNNSGFSFGVVQLDVANNSFAKSALDAILAQALADGTIGQADHDRLASYAGIPRPDLAPAVKSVYQADEALLNTLFATPAAQAVVDAQTDAYLAHALTPVIDAFLTAMGRQYAAACVFDAAAADHRLAWSAVTSTANRTGGLGGSTAYYQAHPPTEIAVVKAHFIATFQADDWTLIETGATLLEQYDAAHPAG